MEAEEVVHVEEALDGGEAGQTEGQAPARRSVRELSRRELGLRGEEMAARRLEDWGWLVLERNWRCPYGEVDIVAVNDDEGDETVVLVEVKTRLALGEGGEPVPELAVGRAKQARYRMLALQYLLDHPQTESVRFDVVAINVVDEENARLRHLPCAFVLDEW